MINGLLSKTFLKIYIPFGVCLLQSFMNNKKMLNGNNSFKRNELRFIRFYKIEYALNKVIRCFNKIMFEYEYFQLFSTVSSMDFAYTT
jgi:hypothetical protein